MLNRLKIAQIIPTLAQGLVAAFDQECTVGMRLWNTIKDDESLYQKLVAIPVSWEIPQWQETLASTLAVPDCTHYQVFGVDGSQIYPDRHRGLPCYVINIGSVFIQYGPQSRVVFESEPYMFAHSADVKVLFSAPELVNGERTEYEFKKSVALARTYPEAVFMFDGALIFWHLDNHDIEIRNRFLASYLTLCEQLYHHKTVHAGYISSPKSKELINIVRRYAVVEKSDFEGSYMVDADIMHKELKPYQVSCLFAHQSALIQSYPEHLRPYFCYLHTGTEVARIEMPAWIALDNAYLNKLIAVVIDQCKKGYGYPVVLSEAHEQAVITTADREFFYAVLHKNTRSSTMQDSTKLLKKKISVF